MNFDIKGVRRVRRRRSLWRAVVWRNLLIVVLSEAKGVAVGNVGWPKRLHGLELLIFKDSTSMAK